MEENAAIERERERVASHLSRAENSARHQQTSESKDPKPADNL